MQLQTVKICNELYRNMLAEFFGTFVLVALVIGAGAQATFSSGQAGSFMSNAFATLMAVTVAVRVGVNASGAHLNPCVSTSFAIIGRFPWQKVPFYILAQFAGSFMGALCAYFVYAGAMKDYVGDTSYKTAEVLLSFTSFPKPFLSLENAFFDIVVAAAFLIMLILAINDEKNCGADKGLAPFFYGILVMTIVSAFGYNSCCAINPARDFGPRVFLAIAGWGNSAFVGPASDYEWWWLPLVAPHVGAFIGALIYMIFIEMHHPDLEDDDVLSFKLKSVTNVIECITQVGKENVPVTENDRNINKM